MPQTTENYIGPERRLGPRSQDEFDQLFDRRMSDHEAGEQTRFAAALERFEASAFPDGREKHFQYHQAKINTAKEEAEFWKAAKLELTKVGVSALGSVIKTVLLLASAGLLYKLGLGGLIGAVVPK